MALIGKIRGMRLRDGKSISEISRLTLRQQEEGHRARQRRVEQQAQAAGLGLSPGQPRQRL